MRRPLVPVVALALAAGGAGAQVAPPGTLPVTPDPSECGIAPRAADEIAALLPSSAAELPEAAETSFVLPPGEPASGPTVAFVVAIVREALACGNAAGFAGVAALVSNAALGRDIGPGAEAGPAELLTFVAGTPPPAPDERRSLLAVLEVRDHGDGTVGALVVVADPTRSPAASMSYVVLVEDAEGTGGSEQYLFLIDGLVADPYGLAGNAGTPAP